MSKPDETPDPRSIDISSYLIPAGEPQAGPSIENPASLLDQDFNFQIVVFKVDNTLFQVLRNGFNVPGTPFEVMFALPQTRTQTDSIEGSSLENPIHLLGIKVDHFRFFLRVLYPFVGQKPVVKFDEWVGVLNLSTTWVFQEIRAKAITKLSELIKLEQKTVKERISLAREYRVVEWLRDAYLEFIERTPLILAELRPAEPYSNGESNPLDWETLARIFYIQTKVTASMKSIRRGSGYCDGCHSDMKFCECRILRLVDETFRGELENLRENLGHVEHPLPPQHVPQT